MTRTQRGQIITGKRSKTAQIDDPIDARSASSLCEVVRGAPVCFLFGPSELGLACPTLLTLPDCGCQHRRVGQAAGKPRRPTIYVVLKMVGRRSLRELVPPYDSAKSQGLAAPAIR
jgi:hypothetical protein